MPIEWKIVIIVAAIILFLILCSLVFVNVIYNLSFKRVKNTGDVFNNLDASANTPWGPFIPYIKEQIKFLQGLKLEDIWIKSTDGLKLHGSYYPAETKTDKVVIIVHGYRGYCYQDYAIAFPFLHDEGYNILFIDLRGHGQSEGNCIAFGVLDYRDLVEWVKYTDNRFEHNCRIFLAGVSMGANTVLMSCNKDLPKSVKAIIADCGYDEARKELAFVCKRNFHLPEFPIIDILQLVVKIRAKYNISEGNTEQCVSNTSIPICFIHGEIDNFVPTYMTKKVYEACNSEKELHLFPNAGHAMSYLLNKEQYQTIIMDFLHKYE